MEVGRYSTPLARLMDHNALSSVMEIMYISSPNAMASRQHCCVQKTVVFGLLYWCWQRALAALQLNANGSPCVR